MLKCKDFSVLCKKHGFEFFTGVPDSTLKSWISFLEDDENLTNIVAVNECEATAICAGYHLSTGKIGVLYMQNDGFAKTVNPLTSLCDPLVYSIPLLLLIGWRGEPGKRDAYQHLKIGKILLPLLDILEIPYEILSEDVDKVEVVLKKAREYMHKNERPFAIIVRKGTFEEAAEKKPEDLEGISREEALKTILKSFDGDELIVSTTGKLSRELFEYRDEKKEGFQNDFYNIGAMGCTQSIALGISLQKKDKKVFVFDGDGSLLMQMGAIVTAGHYSPDNFYHIVFNNEAHDSTGGQSTCSNTVNFGNVALACNYKYGKVVDSRRDLKEVLKSFKNQKGPAMLAIKVKKGARKDLRRPDKNPIEYKKAFIESLVNKK